MLEGDQLVLCALAEDRPGLVAEVGRVLAERRLNVVSTEAAQLGGLFGIMLLVTGEASDLAAVHDGLGELERQTGLSLLARATRPAQPGGAHRVWLELVSADREGLLGAVAQELRDVGGNIVDLEAAVYAAPVSGAPLFRLRLEVDLPPKVLARARQSIADLAEREGLEVTAWRAG